MSQAKHTPGPWKANFRRVTPVDAKQDGTEDLCHVYGDESKEIANARLIASAPDLLEALEWYVHHEDLASTNEHHTIDLRVLSQKARAAIAKATGAI